MTNKDNRPIAFFDSGVGGLTVFSKVKKLLPNENYLYFGDTKNMPYGEKTEDELICFADRIFRFFEKQNAAAYGCANTRKPAQVNSPPTQRPFGCTAWNIIRQTGLSCNGRFWRHSILCMCRIRTFVSGISSCTAFLFFARLPGALRPRRGCGENDMKEKEE